MLAARIRGRLGYDTDTGHKGLMPGVRKLRRSILLRQEMAQHGDGGGYGQREYIAAPRDVANHSFIDELVPGQCASKSIQHHTVIIDPLWTIMVVG